jgi:hypothetical protein
MKEKVIEFLGNLPNSGSESFNKALELYRKTKGHSAEQVRYMNNQGYSPDRLDTLKYELKKLHTVTDLEVAKARRKKVKEVKPENVSKIIVLVKGLMTYDPEKATEEETAQAAETIRINLGLEGNPVDENNELVSDAEFVKAVRGYFEAHQALDEDPEKTFRDLVQIAAESKKTPPVIKDPKIVAFPVADFDKVPSGADDQKDLNPGESDATGTGTNEDKTSEGEKDPVNDNQETPDSVENKMSSEEIDEQAKGAAAEREKFLKEDLSEFDVEEKKYNDIKSFAAELSDYINEDPKDQKGDTLKAFILDAKKKFPAN